MSMSQILFSGLIVFDVFSMLCVGEFILNAEDIHNPSIYRNKNEDVAHRSKRGLMYPGTKWCGDGDNAKNYGDLGSNRKADTCCRDHDHCPDTMSSGTEKHGLNNRTPYTQLHCDCDDRFRECLHNASTWASSMIGSFFFNINKPKCYRLQFPATCIEKENKTDKCLEYSYDTTKEKLWEFFEQPPWKKSNKHVHSPTYTFTGNISNMVTISYSEKATMTSTVIIAGQLTSSAAFRVGTSGASIAILVTVISLFIVLRKYRHSQSIRPGIQYIKLNTEDVDSLVSRI